MKRFRTLERRTFVKGLGTAIALPLLEAMGPRSVANAAEPAAPVRMGFVFFPNGAIMDRWNPEGDGTDFTLSQTLSPLEDHKQDINIFRGLTQHHGRANGDGAGDHARCASSFLTGAQPRKTSGADIKVGQSVDQAAAEVIGDETRLPSLEVGIVRGRNAGNCDSGYSCAYSSNISWKTESTPMAKEIFPQAVFERMFGSRDAIAGQKRRLADRKSILDLVADDAEALRKKLGQTDRRKVDEYFASVREIEQRLERSATKVKDVPEFDVPAGIPSDVRDHMRLMFDLMAIAYQTDTTRIGTYMLGNAGSNRSYPMVDVKDGHHSLSHHRNKDDKMARIARIDKYLVTQYGYFLERLKSIREGEGTLLDNCMILYGSGLSDGNRHQHHDLPIVLAGRGGGTITTGRYVKHPNDTPLNNLFLTMCDRVGAKLDHLGDSTGRLELS